jgi:hypothetical protein
MHTTPLAASQQSEAALHRSPVCEHAFWADWQTIAPPSPPLAQ